MSQPLESELIETQAAAERVGREWAEQDRLRERAERAEAELKAERIQRAAAELAGDASEQQPLSDTDLEAIEIQTRKAREWLAGSHGLGNVAAKNIRADDVLSTDVPRLLAEVRRLRSQGQRPHLTQQGLAPTEALVSVLAERARQDARWGVQDHAPEWWLAILSEEVGELATAILRQHFGTGDYEHRKTDSMRAEAVQVAAVALAFVEACDRCQQEVPS